MSESKRPIREVVVRNTQPQDFAQIVEVCQRVYPNAIPWDEQVLGMHRARFPMGQLVAVDAATQEVLGMSASLIIRWADYDMHHTYNEVTGGGTFSTHDPRGHTLYGAEVMVDPLAQGQGVGKKIYAARRNLCRKLHLGRIRAGARLRNYHQYADRMSAQEYVDQVVAGEIGDPTLSFQMKQDFKVLDVVEGYLPRDPDSRGYAAVIEWLNPEFAQTL